MADDEEHEDEEPAEENAVDTHDFIEPPVEKEADVPAKTESSVKELDDEADAYDHA